MIKIYKDAKGELRWRLVARNGKILADSGEGFTRMGKVKANIRSVAKQFYDNNQRIEEPDGNREHLWS